MDNQYGSDFMTIVDEDGTEYEYEIDAVSGKVISVDKDTTNINQNTYNC